MDGDTILGGHVLELQHKLPMCQVGHLPSPEGRHASELQIFDEDSVVLLAQLMGELPLKGIALIDHLLMVSVKIQSLPFPVMGVWHTFREVPRLTLQLAQSALQELRIVNSRSVAQRHVLLQSEVNTDGCTIVCLSDGLRGLVEHHDDEELSEVVPLDGEGFDLSGIRTAQRELEAFLDTVYGQDVAIQGIAALLKQDGREILCPAELRRTLGQSFEETLVGGIEAFKDFLSSLAMQKVAMNPLSKVGFHLTDADVFMIHAVVSLLQGQCMVPYKAGLTEHLIQVLRSIGTI